MCEKCCVCVYYALCTYLVLTSYTRIYECINTQITKQNNTPPCAASQRKGARGAASEVRVSSSWTRTSRDGATEKAGPWSRRSRNASKALRFRAFAFARFMCEKFLRFEVSHFAATFVDMWRHIFIRCCDLFDRFCCCFHMCSLTITERFVRDLDGDRGFVA